MKKLRIRPEESGLKSTLFDLEAEIMEIIWSASKDTFVVSDIHHVLETRRKIAYTTVMTTISRLYDKELLDRKKEGRGYTYWTTMTRQQFIEETTRQVLESLPPAGKKVAVSYLVEHIAQAGDEELDHLEAMILARRKNT